MDDILTLVCWHTSQRNVYVYRMCLSLKLFAWSYCFLNLLPFKYLIPTLYGRKFHLGLNCFLWLWYGSSVWNSVFINGQLSAMPAKKQKSSKFPFSRSCAISIIKFITWIEMRANVLDPFPGETGGAMANTLNYIRPCNWFWHWFWSTFLLFVVRLSALKLQVYFDQGNKRFATF